MPAEAGIQCWGPHEAAVCVTSGQWPQRDPVCWRDVESAHTCLGTQAGAGRRLHQARWRAYVSLV
jgi:hypothetical protein